MSTLISDIAKTLRTAKRRAQLEEPEHELPEEFGKKDVQDEDPNIALLDTIYEALTAAQDHPGLEAVEELTTNLGLEEDVAFEVSKKPEREEPKEEKVEEVEEAGPDFE